MSRTLYHTPLSPYCRKARIHLGEKKLDFTLEDEPIWERREAFFTLNPAGEVPVLDDEGSIISGSYAIAEYLEEQYPNDSLLRGNAEHRAEARRLVTWFDVKFHQEVSHYILFEKVFRKLMGYGEPDSTTIRIGRQNIHYHLDYLSHLLVNRTWLAGDTLSLADITAAAHLSCLDYLGDIPWEDASLATKEWYALMKSRPSFRPLLTDRVRGFRPPSYYDNPDF